IRSKIRLRDRRSTKSSDIPSYRSNATDPTATSIEISARVFPNLLGIERWCWHRGRRWFGFAAGAPTVGPRPGNCGCGTGRYDLDNLRGHKSRKGCDQKRSKNE